jgi:hypothetical protein
MTFFVDPDHRVPSSSLCPAFPDRIP